MTPRLCIGDRLVLAYLSLAPVYYYLPRVPGLQVNPLRLIGVGLGAAACVYSVRYLPPPGSARMWLSLVAAALVLRVLWSATVFEPLAVFGEAFSMVCFLAMLMVLSAPCSRLSPFTWLVVLAVAGAVGSLLAIGTYLHVVPIPSWSRTEANFLNQRTGWCVDSVLGALGQFACVILIMASARKSHRLIGIACLPLCWLTVILAQFRTHLVVALMLSGGLVAVTTKWRVGRRRLAILVVAFAMLALLAAWNPMGRIGAFVERFRSKGWFDLDDIRHNEIEEEMLLIRSHPLWGTGFGLGRSEMHFVPRTGYIRLYGHNLFTSTAARAGIPLASLAIGGWALLGWVAWRKSQAALTGVDRLVAYGGLGITAVVLLSGRYMNLFTMTIMTPTFALFLAPALRAKPHLRPRSQPDRQR